MRPLRLGRHRNALRSGPPPLKSSSRKFTPQPLPELRVGRTVAVVPAPSPLAVRHWPRRLAGSALTCARWAPCLEGRVVTALPLPSADKRTTSGCASSPRRPLPARLSVTACFLYSIRKPFSSLRLPRGCGAKAHVALPPSSQSPCACSLASRRSLQLPAPGSTDSTPGEHGLIFRAQRFRFRGKPGPEADRAVLEVCVPQVLHVQYGMYVWPCAVVLAQYLWFHRQSLPGKAVLEIGAGVSLPGILAAKCGAQVILSDSAELPHCLDICWQSCQMNNLPQVQVVGLTWGHISQDLLALPAQDIILASDVFFEPEDFENILATVYFLMQRNPKAQLWSTYQVRCADWSLEGLLYKWNMKCIHIPLKSFDADKDDIAESALPGRHTVEMLIISAKDSH